MGQIFNQRNSQIPKEMKIDNITLGTVVATNDPHQMGRLKILCQAYGDDPNDATGTNLPWATYVSPLGGMVNANFKRGPGAGARSKGPVAYGFWNIPKPGSTALVCCVDGDPYYRVWLGSIFDQGCVSSLPHGRYFYKGGSGTPDGPYDGYEDPIEPLSTNLTAAFGSKSGNFEWRTRGADFSVGGNASTNTALSPSTVPDEVDKFTFTAEDGKTFDIKNGYAADRLEGVDDEDNSVYSWTTPGFHAISMDDRPENCRIRIRTSAGAQVLMDDTNERMYISTPQGNNYIEMDYSGNIDVHGRNISFHADEDINFTAGKTVRLFGQQGVHLLSQAEMNLQSAAALNLKAGANLVAKGTMMYLNTQDPAPAKWTMRVPVHEPFARVMTASDYSHTPEFVYNDPNVGLMERGTQIPRGQYWRR